MTTFECAHSLTQSTTRDVVDARDHTKLLIMINVRMLLNGATATSPTNQDTNRHPFIIGIIPILR